MSLTSQAYRVASGIFGKATYSAAIQNDWQKLLDALDLQNLPELSRLRQKYQRDVERDGMGTGTAGAGPGKVSQARRGASQLGRFAQEAMRLFKAQTFPQATAGVDARAVPYFDGEAAVSAPVITEFVRAKREAGYSPKLQQQCCVLETCPACRKSYRFTFVKDGIEPSRKHH